MVRVSGPSLKQGRATVREVTLPPAPNLNLTDFGADAKAVSDRVEKARRHRKSIENAERPSNLWFRQLGTSTYWYMYAVMDYYRSEVSILSTICNRAATELFRHDISFRPKFALKCEDCGYEMQTIEDECVACGSVHLHRPDPTQLDYFKRPNGKSFLDEANNNGQALIDVLKSYGETQWLQNQAYMLCVTGDIVDERTGRLERAYPLEFIALDPKFVQNLFDDTGNPGTTFGFVRDKRDVMIGLDMEHPENSMTDPEGKIIYPAFWKVGSNYGASGDFRLYTKEEIYQDHWFRQSLTYGVPHWFDIEDDLLTFHYIEKHNLKKYKFGYVRKMVILPGFSDEDVEDIMKGIQDILATNDNSIPIICTPPQLQGVAEMRAQTLELGTESASDLIQVKKEIMERICAHGGTPNLLVGDVEASGGMNNESQQITIFDRYMLDKYNFIDRQLRWVLNWFPQITDWELVLNRPSKAYTDARRRMEKMQEAQAMKSLGFKVEYIDGEFRYGAAPEQDPNAMMGGQGGAPAGGGGGMPISAIMGDMGLMPGDGEGPPEKGTVRREDDEVDAAKNEIDLAKRETKDAPVI